MQHWSPRAYSCDTSKRCTTGIQCMAMLISFYWFFFFFFVMNKLLLNFSFIKNLNLQNTKQEKAKDKRKIYSTDFLRICPLQYFQKPNWLKGLKSKRKFKKMLRKTSYLYNLSRISLIAGDALWEQAILRNSCLSLSHLSHIVGEMCDYQYTM